MATTSHEAIERSDIATSSPEASSRDRRWLILAVVCFAQLMVVLDATIVNIALPRAQLSLGFGNSDRQWVVTSYALAFGGLLLIGGRLGDLFGRKRTFLIGLAGFAAASAVGGAAGSFAILVAARACQGMFGALLAPAALSLLSTTFTQANERAKAFALYGAVAGGGGAVGLILGGALTEWLSWRWCLYVNVAIAVPVFAAGLALLSPARPMDQSRIDIPGAVSVSGGLFGLVFGFAHAETAGWGSIWTIGALAVGVVLLSTFVAIERASSNPLLPLRVLGNRVRGSSFLSILVSGAGLFAVFLFLTYYLQSTLGYSPIKTGLAFLPMIVGLGGTAQVATRLLTRVGPRPIVPVGMVLGAVGLILLTRIGINSGYVSHILPGLIVTGVGLGMVFAPSIQGATSGIDPRDAGVGSAAVNTMQQVGGSLGTAIFSTIAASATTTYLHQHLTRAALSLGELHGYVTAFKWAAGLFALGAVLSVLLLPTGPLPTSDDADPTVVA